VGEPPRYSPSYRRHHEYVTVVVDHVRQRVVWVAEGKSVATLARFFGESGPSVPPS
jgi:transposase